MLFFTFIKGGVTPLTGPPNLNGFSSIIRGGGENPYWRMSIRKGFLMKASLSVPIQGDCINLDPAVVEPITNQAQLVIRQCV